MDEAGGGVCVWGGDGREELNVGGSECNVPHEVIGPCASALEAFAHIVRKVENVPVEEVDRLVDELSSSLSRLAAHPFHPLRGTFMPWVERLVRDEAHVWTVDELLRASDAHMSLPGLFLPFEHIGVVRQLLRRHFRVHFAHYLENEYDEAHCHRHIVMPWATTLFDDPAKLSAGFPIERGSPETFYWFLVLGEDSSAYEGQWIPLCVRIDERYPFSTPSVLCPPLPCTIVHSMGSVNSDALARANELRCAEGDENDLGLSWSVPGWPLAFELACEVHLGDDLLPWNPAYSVTEMVNDVRTALCRSARRGATKAQEERVNIHSYSLHKCDYLPVMLAWSDTAAPISLLPLELVQHIICMNVVTAEMLASHCLRARNVSEDVAPPPLKSRLRRWR
eukprot:TRINITY_DN251_c5_g1_i1.p1 TRINITY_DN251_c5_g1~~TRINITY_DN251_c5_g1_i1.p1  ORF type:complete len:407 (-),score=25.38 TRINITY_DN251_c5_g1_i1:61-1242(-)